MEKLVSPHIGASKKCTAKLRMSLLVVTAMALWLPPALSSATESESLLQKESRINECAKIISDYKNNKHKANTQADREEILHCIDLIKSAAKAPVSEPNTIFKSQQSVD